ncbi:MAG TPA: LysM peptidoglycan-binding domain-containing protein [Polyangiaceae bacterium]
MKVIRLFALAALFSLSRDAGAFVHVVRPNESLADIAKRMYGDATREGLVASANALDVQGGSAIVPGMQLQIPACTYHRVGEHETWPGIAKKYLGSEERADALARVNDALAWIAPSPGREVRIPYVLGYIAAEGDTTVEIARRFLGDPNAAWQLEAYNGKKQWKLIRGEVVLVPISSLDLTEAGREEAASSDARTREESGGSALAKQRKVGGEIPALLADVRAGRYVEAVGHGNRLLATSDLTRAQSASIQRALVEAYVALESKGLAAAACDAWHEADPAATLDPAYVSPKIREACRWAH